MGLPFRPEQVLALPAHAVAPGATHPGQTSRVPTLEDISKLSSAGRFAEAEAAARVLLRETERLKGPESVDVAEVLRVLANAMRVGQKARDPETRALIQRAIRIDESRLGPEAEPTLTCMVQLATLEFDLYESEKALELFRHVVEVRERTLGPTSPVLARSLRSLGIAEHRVCSDSAAVYHLERAIRIQRAGGDSLAADLASSFNELAAIDIEIGEMGRAEPLLLDALALSLKAYGPNDLLVGHCEHNLGAFYDEVGDYEASIRYFRMALANRLRSVGKNHRMTGVALSGLGITFADQGDTTRALEYIGKGLGQMERSFGPDHAFVALILMRLGRLDVARGRYEVGRARLERALQIQERQLGPEAPQLSWSLAGLALVQEAEHDRVTARRSYERAIALLERAYGPYHPDRVRFLNDYAGFLARGGDSIQALDVALRSASARTGQLRYAIQGLSERQALVYLPFGASGPDLAVVLAARGVGGADGARRAWDAVARSRNLVLDEMAFRQRNAAAASGDSSLAAAVRAVDEARRRYATLLVRGPGTDSAGPAIAALDRARAVMERAERGLAGRSQAFRAEQTRRDIDLSRVLAALPADAALVAYVLRGRGAGASYVAMVAGPGSSPGIVSLGSARKIEGVIGRWRAQVTSVPPTDRGLAARSAERECRRAGEMVRRLVWDPVASLVKSAARVYVVPDGALCSVSFAGLPVGRNEYLVDRGPLVHLLTSERDLVRDDRQPPVGSGLLALGGPSFDRAEVEPGPDRPGSGDSARAPSRRGPADGEGPALTECPDFEKVRFAPLPGAAREAEEIASMWPNSASAIVLTGVRAGQTEVERLAPGKRVVHLATHGFFLDGSRCATGAGRRGIGGIAPKGGVGPPAASTVAVRVPTGRPLRLSGLALAGANRRSEARSGEDDGILTAEEVASIDLSSVEWAVLSACETGAGSIQPSEGVLGLRRAFQIAGARTVIMSLWGVEDQATLHWMKALYAARFRRGLGTAEAVREASRSVLLERRAQGRSTHPFYWAGFVASGDWR